MQWMVGRAGFGGIILFAHFLLNADRLSARREAFEARNTYSQ
jgi:hypothetical protein